MTPTHRFRDWLASLLPPGYNRSEEKRTFYGTIIIILFYSIVDFSKSYRTAYRLLCDPEILDRQVLLPGAIMEDFVRVLGTNLQMYQWMALALLAIQLWSHYRYFRQGARADYTLRRLPQRYARFRYCWSLPLLEAAAMLVLMVVMLLLFYGYYMASHAGCVSGVRTVAEAAGSRLGNFVVEPVCPAEWRLEILQ